MSAVATLQAAHDALDNPSESMTAFAVQLVKLEMTDMPQLRAVLAGELLNTIIAINPGTRITDASLAKADLWAAEIPADQVRGLAAACRAITEQLATSTTPTERRTIRGAFDRLTAAGRRLCGRV